MFVGSHVPHGICHIPRIHQAIEGRLRFRMRQKQFVQCFIKTDAGIIQCVPIVEDNGSWSVPGIIIAKNLRR